MAFHGILVRRSVVFWAMFAILGDASRQNLQSMFDLVHEEAAQAEAHQTSNAEAKVTGLVNAGQEDIDFEEDDFENAVVEERRSPDTWASTHAAHGFSFKVATLNVLANELALVSLPGFITKERDWQLTKVAGSQWLIDTLHYARDTLGISIIALQEGDHQAAREVTSSGLLDCSIAWYGRENSGDKQLNLCFDPALFQWPGRMKDPTCANDGDMLTMCTLKTRTKIGRVGKGTPIRVVAGHATPTLSEALAVTGEVPLTVKNHLAAATPDLMLMDANQDSETTRVLLKGMGVLAEQDSERTKYKVFPQDRNLKTSAKSKFIFRKLAQAAQSTYFFTGLTDCGSHDVPCTCQHLQASNHCGEPGSLNTLPEEAWTKEAWEKAFAEMELQRLSGRDEWNLWEFEQWRLACTQDPERCKYPEAGSGEHLPPKKEDCKFAVPICKLLGGETVNGTKLEDPRDLLRQAGWFGWHHSAPWQHFDLRSIGQTCVNAFRNSQAGVQTTKVGYKQEDLIIVKKQWLSDDPGDQMVLVHKLPSVESNDTEFPNKDWASDHFLIYTTVKMPGSTGYKPV